MGIRSLFKWKRIATAYGLAMTLFLLFLPKPHPALRATLPKGEGIIGLPLWGRWHGDSRNG